MKILECCHVFHQVSQQILSHPVERIESFYDVSLLENMKQNYARLLEIVGILSSWHIEPGIFNASKNFTEAEVAQNAKELIMEVNKCLLDQNSIPSYNIFAAAVDVWLEKVQQVDYLYVFMEKYLKAVSILETTDEISTDNKNYLKNAFEIEDAAFENFLEHRKESADFLRKKRDDFIQSFVSWCLHQANGTDLRLDDENGKSAAGRSIVNETKSILDTAAEEEKPVTETLGETSEKEKPVTETLGEAAEKEKPVTATLEETSEEEEPATKILEEPDAGEGEPVADTLETTDTSKQEPAMERLEEPAVEEELITETLEAAAEEKESVTETLEAADSEEKEPVAETLEAADSEEKEPIAEILAADSEKKEPVAETLESDSEKKEPVAETLEAADSEEKEPVAETLKETEKEEPVTEILEEPVMGEEEPGIELLEEPAAGEEEPEKISCLEPVDDSLATAYDICDRYIEELNAGIVDEEEYQFSQEEFSKEELPEEILTGEILTEEEFTEEIFSKEELPEEILSEEILTEEILTEEILSEETGLDEDRENAKPVTEQKSKHINNEHKIFPKKQVILEPLYIECLKIIDQWMQVIKDEEFQKQEDDFGAEEMCWDLLHHGQFALARELADTFHRLCRCVEPAVIDLVGIGLYLPITDKETIRQYLCCHPFLQTEHLLEYEKTAVALAMIPIAHCSKEVKFGKEMIQMLPEFLHPWLLAFLNKWEKLAYLDLSVIEAHRNYCVRLKKIKAVMEKASVKFQNMTKASLPYGREKTIMTDICSKDQCIGILQELLTSVDAEIQAHGIIEPDVKGLYRTAREYFSEQKNTSKNAYDDFINDMIENGQKKYKCRKESVKSNRPKMVQLIREYLQTISEWMDLIKTPCNYNSEEISSYFIEEMAQLYQMNRPKLNAYAEESTGKVLRPVTRQLVSVMDYLMGESEELPLHCKPYVQHVYRLCTVPSTAIQKNELGIYRYTCKDPLERLQFLASVMQGKEKPAEKNLEDFIEADAFSGCGILFEMLPSDQYAHFREYYRERINKRLEELPKDIRKLKKKLYEVSVRSGWMEKEYQSAQTMLTQIEYMLEDPKDVSMICAMLRNCDKKIDALNVKFRKMLKSRVQKWTKNTDTNRMEKLYAMIDEGNYAAVFEWMENPKLTDTGLKEKDFFSDRYFQKEIYAQKEKTLLSYTTVKELSEQLQKAVKHTLLWKGFDYNRASKSAGYNRAKLLRFWYETKADLQYNKQPDDENLKQILELLGWQMIKLENKICSQDDGRLKVQFDMYFSPSYSRTECQVPLFGSKSGGRIRMLCLQGGAQAPDKLHRLYESCHKEIPMVILLFGVLTYSRRMELYHLMLETRASFLVVDDMILATICESRNQLLLPQLYSLTVPFSAQSMYTSSLGVVHPEMFYGRKAAKEELGLKGNVCAVYGGRQLGKTALLKNIELEQHQPKVDHFVYYIKLPTETVMNTDLLLTNLIKNCISRDILPADREYPDMDSLLTEIGIWVQQKDTRKLLLLLDEADQFLLAESKENFSVTSKINGLMTTTNLQFKVVFAGLHNVYRTFSMPNHPLVHWGEPISIGPLLNDELQDAINLIRQPFEVMGYRFDSLDVIIRILAETNYYPSLIQVFCKSLHNYLTTNLRDKKNTSLPVVIYMENIEEVLNDLALKEEISQRFMWTLNLDERYKAIALSIAFDAANTAQDETSNDIVKGYDLHWIKAEMNKWPELFAGHSSLESIRGLCDELVQLGILCYVFENRSRYTLRTVNILNMLGTQENILTEMYALYEKKYDYTMMYNSKLSRRVFKDDGKCYPFTNQQIDAVFNSGGLKFVAGNHALGFDLIEKCLKDLLASESNESKDYSLAVYDKSLPELSELGGSKAVNLILPECTWEFDSIIEYGTKLNQLPEQDRPILIVLCEEAKSYQARMEFHSEIVNFPFLWLDRELKSLFL